MTTNAPVDLTKPQLDKDGRSRYAIYLPAISSFYNKYVSNQRISEAVPADRIPKGFDRGIEGMNFLNEEQGYFTYKYGLYSAGHARLDLNETMVKESMIQHRDRNKTIIIGDSGGFQIGTGVLKFDWANFEGPAANKVRQQILEWLEVTADWSMMLDVPSWGMNDVNSSKTGLKTFQDCLDKTIYNNNYFLKNRLGNTKFLNVLQGNDWETAEQWYEGVKGFSDPNIWGDKAAEGWAFGGANMCNMPTTLRRLMVLREDGYLTDKNWIHFLGTAQLDWACYLTAIQREIRKHINENINISFDCASPFVSTAHGLVYTTANHTSKKWSIIMGKAFDSKSLCESDIPFPYESEFGRRLTVGDICRYKPGMVNKFGKEGKTSWDSFAYALLMGHNVQTHITAVQRANQLAEIYCSLHKPDWRKWRKVKTLDKSDDPSDLVPRNILYFSRFVEELFETKTKDEAFEMIKSAEPFLLDLEGHRRSGGAKNTVSKFFDMEDSSHNDIDVTDPNDKKLLDLENSDLTDE